MEITTLWDPRALEVLDRLSGAGYSSVLVGGCVRDSLLRLSPHDYDVATAARPQAVKALFSHLPCVETGLRHGTVTVFSGGLPVEVTTFRREGDYSDHRRPDHVEFTDDLEEDLKRRDFTINAMAWNRAGLVDRYGGKQDLSAGQVRCVGDPDRRFEEDALRVLRGLRLCAQLDFTLEERTAAALRRHIPQLSHVAWERIAGEFVRLLCSPGAGRVLLEFPQAAVQIIPELGDTVGFDQKNPHHRYDVYTHSVKALEAVPPTAVLRLAALLHDIGKPSSFTVDSGGTGHFYGHAQAGAPLAKQALERLRLDRSTQEAVAALVERHHLEPEPNQRWVGRWLSRLGEECFFQLLALKRADGIATGLGRENPVLAQCQELARTLLAQRACLSLRDLAVNGRDALAADLSGPAVGRALDSLLDQVAQGLLPNERGVLLEELNRHKP